MIFRKLARVAGDKVRQARVQVIVRQFWAGVVAGLGALALVVGELARIVPGGTPVTPLARIVDSLAPWALVVALLAGLLVLGLGSRWVGALLCAGAVGAGAHLWVDHRAVSLPLTPGRTADLRVIFFNVYGENAAFSDRIASAVIEADPDVVVFAEAEAVYAAMRRLGGHFDFISPCAFDDCQVVVATKRDPLRFWRLTLNDAFPDRYAVAELETDGGKRVFLAAAHLVKPWLSGIAEPEQARLISQYDWLSGPVVGVGDFNAAPWGQSLHAVLRGSGMRALRVPIPSWPRQAGGLGVPIDHVLVKGGARVVAARPFGDALNSNHRGILADIALP